MTDGKRCKWLHKWVNFDFCYYFKVHSPLVVCTFFVARHEKSLNKEFQGGVCSAKLAGFDFTWTTDIEVEHLCSPTVPYVSSVFHGNHTRPPLLETHHKTEDPISSSRSPHLGSWAHESPGHGSCAKNVGCDQAKQNRSLMAGKITARKSSGQETTRGPGQITTTQKFIVQLLDTRRPVGKTGVIVTPVKQVYIQPTFQAELKCNSN